VFFIQILRLMCEKKPENAILVGLQGVPAAGPGLARVRVGGHERPATWLHAAHPSPSALFAHFYNSSSPKHTLSTKGVS
jgi:hypothetical protein